MRDYCLVCRSEDDALWVENLTIRTGYIYWNPHFARAATADDPMFVHLNINQGQLMHHSTASCLLGDIPSDNIIHLLHSPHYNHARMLAFLRLLPNRASELIPASAEVLRFPTDSPFCGVHPVKSKRKIIPVPI